MEETQTVGTDPTFIIEGSLDQAKPFELVTAGTHNAVLIQYEDLGLQQKVDKKGQPLRDDAGNIVMAPQCCLTFEVEEENSDGYRKTIRRWFNRILNNPEAALRKTVEEWLNRPLSNDDMPFDMSDFLGKSALLQVKHKPKLNGEPKNVIAYVLPATQQLMPSREVIKTAA